MKKSLLLLTIFVLGFVIFTGQKTQDGPRWSGSTVLYPSGEYVPLPSVPDRYVQFSTVPRVVNTPAGILVINPNVRVLPSTSTAQTELYLASNKANRNVMFGSSNAVTGGATINSGCYVTTNNGTNWGGYQQINSNNPNDQRGDPGPAVDKNMNFVFSHLVSATNFGGLTGMGANYSSNYGANWSSTFMLETNANVDKNLSNTDDSPTSPYYGQSYTVWTNLAAVNSKFAKTTNGGLTWDPTMIISTGLAGHGVQGHDVACGPNGEVYVTWVTNMSSGQYAADYIGFGKSTNGGANFTSLDNAIDVNGARNNGAFGGWGIRVNDFPRIDVDKSGGPRNGWIYIVIMEISHAPAGSDEDIVLYRSSNAGVSWMPGVRVNQDALNNGKRQFFPAVRVDDFGGLNIIYYDNRNYPNADSATVMVSRSIDGGATFTDIEIADHHFKPKAATGMSGGYMGDYIGLAIGNNKVWGFWMDDKAGSVGFYNAWASSIEIGPAINHTPLTNTEQIAGTRTVSCTITPAGSGINPGLTKLFYAKNNTSFTGINLTFNSGINWSANLPLSGAGTYNYYLTTTDSISRVATAPGGAPANYYSFTATADTVKPVITTTPLPDVPKINWPATITATATDNIGIDSVWVKWYKNNTGTGIKQFKLLLTTGSTFAAAFNSVQADVAYNDSIFYRVFARDNSSGHNADSTALYKFKIINITNACVGTGTTSVGYPFYTYYDDSRTDLLYTAAEINAAGGGPGFIQKLGFDVITPDAGVMNGFKIKIQNTTNTSIAAYTSTGWTTCYDGTYTVPGTGLQYIQLTTPFYYTGTNNILIEICFNNSAWTASSNINATAATGRVVHQHQDLATGDGCVDIVTPGTGYTALPNICFYIGLGPLSAGNNNLEIPSVYSLSQNYPNPFNPVTKINFAIPKQGLVTLKIFDILGREVRTLVNEMKTPGNYAVDFNGSELSSGVYFYRLQSAEFTDLKRMMLIK